jgi:hypothetical protein
MKTKAYSLLALAAGLLLVAGTFNLLHGQEITKASSSAGEAERALQYFKQIGNGKGNLDEYLRSIRPGRDFSGATGGAGCEHSQGGHRCAFAREAG